VRGLPVSPFTTTTMSLPETHQAVRLHEPGVIKVKAIPAPKIEHPDDAIVKVTVSR